MRAGVVIQAAAVALSGVATAMAVATLIFVKQQPDLVAGVSPAAVAAADLDGDGKIDLAVANFDSDDVSIFWGNGDGSYSAPGVPLSVGAAISESPVAIVIADVNGDGKPDILTANEAGNTVSVLLNLGQRQFGAAIETPTGNMPEDLVVADFNGDKVFDVATPNYLDDTVTVLLGNQDGGFSALSTCSNPSGHVCRTSADCLAGATCNPAPIPVGTEPDAVAAADFNQDGTLDLVVANSGGGASRAGSLTVLQGVGNGLFVAQPEIESPSFENPVRIAAGDLNNDGKPDLVVVDEVGDWLSVLLGNGNLTFQNASVLDVGGGTLPHGVVLADFNGDRNLDIACSGTLQDKVTVFAGTGSGAFAAPQDFALAMQSMPYGIAVADLNQDGRADLAVANMQKGTVSVLLNATPRPCPGDCNGDRTVTVDEILAMVNIALGEGSVASCTAGDTNGDRQITVDEILGGVDSALNGCGA